MLFTKATNPQDAPQRLAEIRQEYDQTVAEAELEAALKNMHPKEMNQACIKASKCGVSSKKILKVQKEMERICDESEKQLRRVLNTDDPDECERVLKKSMHRRECMQARWQTSKHEEKKPGRR